MHWKHVEQCKDVWTRYNAGNKNWGHFAFAEIKRSKSVRLLAYFEIIDNYRRLIRLFDRKRRIARMRNNIYRLGKVSPRQGKMKKKWETKWETANGSSQ